MATRNADRVLPDPVGALTSVSAPARMAGQAPNWAAVGPPPNRPQNQARTAGWKSSSTPPGGALRLSVSVLRAVTLGW